MQMVKIAIRGQLCKDRPSPMRTALDPDRFRGLAPVTLDDEILDVDDVARLLKLEKTTVRVLARQGKLPARKIGKEWRFSRYVLLAWLQTPQKGGLPSALPGTRSPGATEDDANPTAPSPRRQRKRLYDGLETVSQSEAAHHLGVTPRTVQRMVADGRLPTIEAGKKRRILRSALPVHAEGPTDQVGGDGS
ncbi:MAG: helix-turn-helix domain-containing protein [Thermoleophilia bacterium]